MFKIFIFIIFLKFNKSIDFIIEKLSIFCSIFYESLWLHNFACVEFLLKNFQINISMICKSIFNLFYIEDSEQKLVCQNMN